MTASVLAENRCRVDVCELVWDDDGGIFQIRGVRFLHHMVRNLEGLLLEIGRGARRPDDVDRILAAGDRRAAGMMAPAHGLFLEEVGYPEALLDPGYLPTDPSGRPPAVAEGD